MTRRHLDIAGFIRRVRAYLLGAAALIIANWFILFGLSIQQTHTHLDAHISWLKSTHGSPTLMVDSVKSPAPVTAQNDPESESDQSLALEGLRLLDAAYDAGFSTIEEQRLALLRDDVTRQTASSGEDVLKASQGWPTPTETVRAHIVFSVEGLADRLEAQTAWLYTVVGLGFLLCIMLFAAWKWTGRRKGYRGNFLSRLIQGSILRVHTLGRLATKRSLFGGKKRGRHNAMHLSDNVGEQSPEREMVRTKGTLPELMNDAIRRIGLGAGLVDAQGRLEEASPELVTMACGWSTVNAWWRDLYPVAVNVPSHPCVVCGEQELRGTISGLLLDEHQGNRVFEVAWGGHAHGFPDGQRRHIVLIRETSDLAETACSAGDTADMPQWQLDPLTGILNRNAFVRAVSSALNDLKEGRTFNFAVASMDVDAMGLINDTLGNKAGDQVLRATSERLQNNLGDVDVIARLGDDEFGVLFRDVAHLSDLKETIEQIQASLSQVMHFGNQDVVPTASIGLVTAHEGYPDGASMIRQAELALRRASKRGVGNYEIFEGAPRHDTRRTLRLSTDLHRALERGEFELFYQPMVPMRPGVKPGFETLIRWHHPEFGILGPNDFIPLAEATGSIEAIGLWVIEEACSQLSTWHRRFWDQVGPISLSVNLSTRQLQQPNLVTEIERLIKRNRIAPEFLKLEITESAVMEDPDGGIAILENLRSLGTRLWVDDFGTGYSSLSYLQRLPIDGLKIDRSFITPITRGNESGNLVRSIIDLGHNLNLDVVAEGVETLPQFELLCHWGCDVAQGHHFSTAVSAQVATTMLLQWRDRFGHYCQRIKRGPRPDTENLSYKSTA